MIIGGGWTGLAMAKELTSRTSLSVVVLERGPARKLSDYAAGMDEVDYSIRKRLMQNIAEETVTHRHTIRDSAVPVRQYGHFLPGTGVGGSGEHWQESRSDSIPTTSYLRRGCAKSSVHHDCPRISPSRISV